MRSLARTGPGGPAHAASRPTAPYVSPATLRIAHEADATMSPDGWEAEYAALGPLASPVFLLAKAVPAA